MSYRAGDIGNAEQDHGRLFELGNGRMFKGLIVAGAVIGVLLTKAGIDLKNVKDREGKAEACIGELAGESVNLRRGRGDENIRLIIPEEYRDEYTACRSANFDAEVARQIHRPVPLKKSGD